MEIAFVSSNKVKAEIDIKKGGIISQILNIFYTHRETFISTMLVGNNIVHVVYGIGIAWLLKKPLEGWLGEDNEALVLLIQTIISTAIVLVMAEFLPKTAFRINPNRSLRVFAVPLLFLYLILYPISQFTSWLSMVLMRLFGIKNEKNEIRLISVGELDDYLQENIDKSEDENREVEREVKIFENALDFSDTRLRDCMIPRNEIVGVDIAETSREELSEIFTRSGLSKLVVYHDDIDNVLGFIQVSEMFKPTDVNWKDQIKPVIIAPETMLAKKMMQNLLKEKKSMAIVVDEFGGTAGMITLEDLVEEIFGDIEAKEMLVYRHGDVARIKEWIQGLSGEVWLGLDYGKMFSFTALGGYEHIWGPSREFEVSPVEYYAAFEGDWLLNGTFRIAHSLRYRSDARWNLRSPNPMVVKGDWYWDATFEQQFPKYGLFLTGTLLHVLSDEVLQAPNGSYDRLRFVCTVRKTF